VGGEVFNFKTSDKVLKHPVFVEGGKKRKKIAILVKIYVLQSETSMNAT
jgi:hypothetical protein